MEMYIADRDIKVIKTRLQTISAALTSLRDTMEEKYAVFIENLDDINKTTFEGHPPYQAIQKAIYDISCIVAEQTFDPSAADYSDSETTEPDESSPYREEINKYRNELIEAMALTGHENLTPLIVEVGKKPGDALNNLVRKIDGEDIISRVNPEQIDLSKISNYLRENKIEELHLKIQSKNVVNYNTFSDDRTETVYLRKRKRKETPKNYDGCDTDYE